MAKAQQKTPVAADESLEYYARQPVPVARPKPLTALEQMFGYWSE